MFLRKSFIEGIALLLYCDKVLNYQKLEHIFKGVMTMQALDALRTSVRRAVRSTRSYFCTSRHNLSCRQACSTSTASALSATHSAAVLPNKLMPVASSRSLKTAARICLCAALFLGALMLSSCMSSSFESADSNTLTVGFDASYPPYGFMGQDGTYQGFDLDLAREVAKRTGMTFKAAPIDWDTKDVALNSGMINCIWNGFTKEGRENLYTFSEPYMMNAQVVVVRSDSPIKELSDLSKKAVLTQVESAADKILKTPASSNGRAELASQFSRLDTVADYNAAFLQLESGVVDAVACDMSIAAYQLAQSKTSYRILDEKLSSEHYAVAFAKGNTALAQKVTDTLREMYKDGTVKKLCDNYASYGLRYDGWVLK